MDTLNMNSLKFQKLMTEYAIQYIPTPLMILVQTPVSCFWWYTYKAKEDQERVTHKLPDHEELPWDALDSELCGVQRLLQMLIMVFTA